MADSNGDRPILERILKQTIENAEFIPKVLMSILMAFEMSQPQSN